VFVVDSQDPRLKSECITIKTKSEINIKPTLAIFLLEKAAH